MASSIWVWTILVTIGVSDAKEHRIPNLLVLCLLLCGFIDVVYKSGGISWQDLFKSNVMGFFVFFCFGLIFYLSRIMTAGDVKLLAVVGFILGDVSFLEFFKYTLLVFLFIGLMYFFLNRLERSNIPFNRKYCYFSENKKNKSTNVFLCSELDSNLTFIPFAPVLVIGLAVFEYF